MQAQEMQIKANNLIETHSNIPFKLNSKSAKKTIAFISLKDKWMQPQT